MHICVSGESEVTLGVIYQVLSTLFFETVSLTRLEFIRKARLASMSSRAPPVSAPPAPGSQACTTISDFAHGF